MSHHGSGSGGGGGEDCQINPTFQNKPVYELRCAQCMALLCIRGMRAILLSDVSVELYSTDLPPPGALQLVRTDYDTDNCMCRIRDVACYNCGAVAGYHVTLPCRSCLQSCHNGHFWMFHSGKVSALERLDKTGQNILVWAKIPPTAQDDDMNITQQWVDCCR